MGEGLLLYKAIELKEQGKTMQEIAEWLEEKQTSYLSQCDSGRSVSPPSWADVFQKQPLFWEPW